jgi:anthranilate synthase component 2
MRLLLLDNYDSFTFNLAHLFGRFGLEVVVRRNDRISLDGIRELAPDCVCISPGPRTPTHAGICAEVVRTLAPRLPILGVCLGMQVINEVYGGRTVRAPAPVHGKRSRIVHGGGGLFASLPSPFLAARYHSLQVADVPAELLPLAHGEDGVVMGLRHWRYPVHGVQFHPESFLGEHGDRLAENFLQESPAFTGLCHTA